VDEVTEEQLTAFERRILFEDNHVLVVLKEPNELTQGDKTGDQDLLSKVKSYVKHKYDKPGDAYIGLVHRMDRPVGGLLAFAKTSKAAQRLSEQLREKKLKREYVCVCAGQLPPAFTLRDFLYKDTKSNMVTIVPSYLRKGKEAILHAQKIASVGDTNLVCIRLETGRAHQIRVQMAGFNSPLIFDQRYGGETGRGQIALWGMRLSFDHPITKKHMVFVAPPPFEGIWQTYQKELQLLTGQWPTIIEQLPEGTLD
jgi:23S rRNA pseudouridine1911/1915/1917 synthase